MNKVRMAMFAATAGALGSVSLAGAAWADNPDYGKTPPKVAPTCPAGTVLNADATKCVPPKVLGVALTNPASGTPSGSVSTGPAAPVAALASTTSTSSTLPFTGAEIGGMSGLAGAAILVGGGLVLASRRRQES